MFGATSVIGATLAAIIFVLFFDTEDDALSDSVVIVTILFYDDVVSLYIENIKNYLN